MPDSVSSRVTGGMAIVDALIANGVEQLFGIPGSQMYGLFDALHLRSGQIRTFGARHEQACGYMAFGYARSTGRPGVFSVVPGPGILNAGAALVTALGCCTPMLCVTGQVPTAFIGKGRGHLHEIPDQLATLRGLTKWSERIERIEDAPAIINEAFRQMLSGKPGPVAVEMAWDLMIGSADVTPLPAAVRPAPLAPIAAEIEAAADIIAAAWRPMIMTGSGAQHAHAAVTELAELLDAPVAALRGGRGIVAEDHPLGISSHAARLLWPETDVLIGIGSRIEAPYVRWSGIMNLIEKPVGPPALVRIDIDPQEFRRLVPDAGIVGDSGLALTALLAAIRRRQRPPVSSTAIRSRIAGIKQQARADVDVVQPQLAYLDVIRAELPRDGIFVTELCQVGFASYFGFPVYAPYTYVSEGYQGTLGWGLAGALGAKVAHPDNPVISVTGDGGFMFGMQELATAVQENIGVVILLFNNDAYGNIKRDQTALYDGRVSGSTLKNPDFLALAKAFGIEAHRVDSPETLRPRLAAAIASSTPTLIEIDLRGKTEVSPWPFINPPVKS